MCKLTFIFSSMNSGKSLALLAKNYMLKEKGFTTVLMKPEVDDRSEHISSRLGIEQSCSIIGRADLPSAHVLNSDSQRPDIVLIDEAQFLNREQIWDLANLVDNWNINVYCYGLKLNWQGEFFEGSHELFKIADELEPIENYCKYNKGAPAFFHVKLGGSDASVEVGAEELYESVSRKEWSKWWQTKK